MHSQQFNGLCHSINWLCERVGEFERCRNSMHYSLALFLVNRPKAKRIYRPSFTAMAWGRILGSACVCGRQVAPWGPAYELSIKRTTGFGQLRQWGTCPVGGRVWGELSRVTAAAASAMGREMRESAGRPMAVANLYWLLPAAAARARETPNTNVDGVCVSRLRSHGTRSKK